MDAAEPVAAAAPLLSVVVPVYNAEEYLAQCLDSILAQTMGDFELICVDDGSTDGSPAMLATYAARDPRVAVVRQKNAGVSAARNAGIDRARGRYINFLDADDWFEPQMFERMCGALERDGADVCVCWGYHYDMRTGETTEMHGYLHMERLPGHIPFTPEDISDHLFDFTMFPCYAKMMRRSLLERNGIRHRPYRNCADVVFTSQILLASRLITVVNEPLFTYRLFSGTSLTDTVSKNILVSYQALMEVKGILEAGGVYERYERSFTNKALGHLLSNLGKVATYEALALWYETVVGHGFADLGILGRDEDYFYNRAQYQRLQQILSTNDPGELAFALYRQNQLAKDRAASRARTLKAKNARLRERDAALRERVAALKAKYTSLRGRFAALKDKNARLRERNAALRERVAALKDKNFQLQGRNERLSDELERIKGSRSYRFARRLSAIARRFRR